MSWTQWTHFCLTTEHLFCILINAFIRHPLMFNNLAISPHLATFYYQDQLPFTIPSERIRSSLFLITNPPCHRNSIPYLDRLHEGGFEPDLNYFSIPTISIASEKGSNFKVLRNHLNQYLVLLKKQQSWTAHNSPALKGRVEPQLNGFSILEKAFELDSFRLRSALNLHYLTSFTNYLSTQSPITQFLVPEYRVTNIQSRTSHTGFHTYLSQQEV